MECPALVRIDSQFTTLPLQFDNNFCAHQLTIQIAEPVDVVAVRVDPKGPVEPAALDEGLNHLIEVLLGDLVLHLELDLHQNLAREPPVDVIGGLPILDAVVEDSLMLDRIYRVVLVFIRYFILEVNIFYTEYELKESPSLEATTITLKVHLWLLQGSHVVVKPFTVSCSPYLRDSKVNDGGTGERGLVDGGVVRPVGGELGELFVVESGQVLVRLEARSLGHTDDMGADVASFKYKRYFEDHPVHL